jgi:hypothetical protein
MQIFSKSDLYVHGKNEMVKVAKNVREEVIVRQKNSCEKQGCDGEKKNVMVRQKNSCERQRRDGETGRIHVRETSGCDGVRGM